MCNFRQVMLILSYFLQCATLRVSDIWRLTSQHPSCSLKLLNQCHNHLLLHRLQLPRSYVHSLSVKAVAYRYCWVFTFFLFQSTPVRRPRMANTSPSGGPAVRPNISIVLPATLAQSDQPNVFIITDPSQTEGVLQVSFNHLLSSYKPFKRKFNSCALFYFFSKSRNNSTLKLWNL